MGFQGKKIIKGKTSFVSNYLWGKVMRNTDKAVKPDKSIVDRYANFLENSYAEMLKLELPARKGRRVSRGYGKARESKSGNFSRPQIRPTLQGLGHASGALRENITAEAKVNVVRKKTGTYHIKYELTPNIFEYGDYIAEGRKSGWIPIKELMKWIAHKRAKGYFTVQKKEGQSQGKADLSFAFAIANIAKKNPKPAVIDNWYNINKNEDLYIRYLSRVRIKGRKYRVEMRESIIRKLKEQE